MRTVLAIDPGPEKSAYIVWNGAMSFGMAECSNDFLRASILSASFAPYDFVALEMVACYGMAVGAETFDTCRWVGRFQECAARPSRLIYRKDVKMHLCHSMRVKDANIRQALIDKHGAPGTKKAPGKLFGVSGHLWAALAVADYALENL